MVIAHLSEWLFSMASQYFTGGVVPIFLANLLLAAYVTMEAWEAERDGRPAKKTFEELLEYMGKHVKEIMPEMEKILQEYAESMALLSVSKKDSKTAH